MTGYGGHASRPHHHTGTQGASRPHNPPIRSPHRRFRHHSEDPGHLCITSITIFFPQTSVWLSTIHGSALRYHLISSFRKSWYFYWRSIEALRPFAMLKSRNVALYLHRSRRCSNILFTPSASYAALNFQEFSPPQCQSQAQSPPSIRALFRRVLPITTRLAS
jgi:hypothetical protein